MVIQRPNGLSKEGVTNLQKWSVLGNADHHAFSHCIGWLKVYADCSFCEADVSVEQLASQDPETLLLLYGVRGQFGQSTVEQLQQRFPLARFVALCGSWCEGETRSGSPISGIERYYVHEFIPRFSRELLDTETVAINAKTASSEETWLNRHGNETPFRMEGLVMIVGNDRSICDAISEACQQLGLRSAWNHNARSLWADSPDFVVYDADRDFEERSKTIGQLRRKFPTTSLILLVDFPRSFERDAAHEQGVSAVLSKPFDVNAFHALLGNAIKA